MPSVSYENAMNDVRACVKSSRTSFGAGMAILPKEKREAMYALYAFCREVDDIADDGATLEERRKGLQDWRERVRKIFRSHKAEHYDQNNVIASEAKPSSPETHKKALKESLKLDRHALPSQTKEGLAMTVSCSDPISQTLAVARTRFPLVEEDFQAIIDGMVMDAGDPIVAPDEATLDLYCDRVASAVGRVSVRIFGDDSENGLAVAHYLGRALQLTNILRDLAEDAARGRLYLPRELLEKHGIASRKPEEILKHANLPLACRDLAARAKEHFAKADAAMKRCRKGTMRPARVMRNYYAAVLDELIAGDWRDPSRRVTLPRWKKIWLVIKSLAE